MKKITVLLGLSALIFVGCKKDDGPGYVLETLTFENIPAASLAGPTASGENLYSAYGEGQFTGYSDIKTGLTWEINEGYGAIDFWNGGIAASRWNDKATAGHPNACSVYFGDPGKGGHNDSQTFGIAYAPASLSFNSAAVGVFDHLWLCNATYTALSMKNGDDFAKKFSYEDQDWLKLIIAGTDAAGAVIETTEYYLADFRTDFSGGIREGWHRIDLSVLGPVNGLAFTLESSDVGEYGLNPPAYFCIDDIAVRQ